MDNSLRICVCVCVFFQETTVTSVHVSKAVMDKPGLVLHFPCQRVPHCLLKNQFNTEPIRISLWSARFELVITFKFVIGCNQSQSDDCMETVKRNVKSPNDQFPSSLRLFFTWSPPLMCVWDVPFPYGWICQYQSYKSWSVYPVRSYISVCVRGWVLWEMPRAFIAFSWQEMPSVNQGVWH